MKQENSFGRVDANITIPSYANLYLKDDHYAVSVTFHVTKEMYDYMKVIYQNVKYFDYTRIGNKYYCRFLRKYRYTVPFSISLFKIAEQDKDTLKIMMRQAKIALLECEIHQIKMR